MEKQIGRYSYEMPESDTPHQIVWKLGSDGLSTYLSSQLDYQPSTAEIDFVSRVVNRESQALAKVRFASGRNLVLQAEPLNIGINYDSMQISGFGYQRFSIVENGYGLFERNAPIKIPTADNFALSHTDVTLTQIATEKGYRHIGDAYSFTGAYTRRQAIFKVAANIAIWEELSRCEPVPFAIPIPIAVGRYSNIRNRTNEPAYFIAFRVPFQGKRSGIFETGEFDKNPGAIAQRCMLTPPKIAYAARILHTDLNLTHNQLGMGNYFVSPENHVFIADFSTVRPIAEVVRVEAIAQELYTIIYVAMLGFSKVHPKGEDHDYLDLLYRGTLGRYLGEPPKFQPRRISALREVLIRELKRKEPRPRMVVDTGNPVWAKIQKYQRDFEFLIPQS